MLRLLVVLALTQSPVDVPPAPVPELPSLTAPVPVAADPAPAALEQRFVLRKADLHQGSFVLREVVAGFVGEAVALVALTGTTALGYGLFSRCSVHGIVVDVLRIGCPTTTPDWPLAIAGTSELVLVPLGAALGARLAVGHPFSGSLWRALGYALLVELATFVTGAFLSVALNAKDSDIPIDLVLATSAAAFPPLASSGLHLSPQSKRPVPRGTGRACFALRSD